MDKLANNPLFNALNRVLYPKPSGQTGILCVDNRTISVFQVNIVKYFTIKTFLEIQHKSQGIVIYDVHTEEFP